MSAEAFLPFLEPTTDLQKLVSHKEARVPMALINGHVQLSRGALVNHKTGVFSRQELATDLAEGFNKLGVYRVNYDGVDDFTYTVSQKNVFKTPMLRIFCDKEQKPVHWQVGISSEDNQEVLLIGFKKDGLEIAVFPLPQGHTDPSVTEPGFYYAA